MMGQTEQSEHIATGLKFIEAEVIVKLREREGQGVDLGRSLKGHL